MLYNGLGQLVSKTANGVTTQYLIDDLSPTGYPQVVEERVNGQVARTYTYGLERISELQMVDSTPTASFYQYDGRGTVRMLTNSGGQRLLDNLESASAADQHHVPRERQFFLQERPPDDLVDSVASANVLAQGHQLAARIKQRGRVQAAGPAENRLLRAERFGKPA
jgi:hypothetical protein